MSATNYTKFLKAFTKFQEEYNRDAAAKLIEVLGLEGDEQCQKVHDTLASCIAKPDTMSGKGGGPKKKRAPTEYNLFMKERIMKLRLEHPDIDKKELMSMGAQDWQRQKADKLKATEAAAAAAAAATPSKPEKKSKK